MNLRDYIILAIGLQSTIGFIYLFFLLQEIDRTVTKHVYPDDKSSVVYDGSSSSTKSNNVPQLPKYQYYNGQLLERTGGTSNATIEYKKRNKPQNNPSSSESASDNIIGDATAATPSSSDEIKEVSKKKKKYTLQNVLSTIRGYDKGISLFVYDPQRDTFIIHSPNEIIWEKARFANISRQLAYDLRHLYPDRFRTRFNNNSGTSEFAVAVAWGEYPFTTHLGQTGNTSTTVDADNDNGAFLSPVLQFGSVFKKHQHQLLPTSIIQTLPNVSMIAMPMPEDNHHLDCFHNWVVQNHSGMVCHGFKTPITLKTQLNDDSSFSSLWKELIPQVIWRGEDTPYLPRLLHHPKMPDFDTIIDLVLSATKKEKYGNMTQEQAVVVDADIAVQGLRNIYDKLKPRWKGIVVSAEAERDAANNNENGQNKNINLPWANIRFTKTDQVQLSKKLRKIGVKIIDSMEDTKKMSLDTLARYRYHIDLGGTGGTSWRGTLEKLALPGLLFHHETPTKDYIHDMIRPWVHYVPVRSDLMDLKEKFDWAQSHPEKAMAISQRATSLVKMFGTEAGFEKLFNQFYWRPLHQVVNAYQPLENSSSWQEVMSQEGSMILTPRLECGGNHGSEICKELNFTKRRSSNILDLGTPSSETKIEDSINETDKFAYPLTKPRKFSGPLWTLDSDLKIVVPITMMLIKNSLLWCPIEKSGSTTVYNILYQNGFVSERLFLKRCGDDCPLVARKALRNWSAPKPLSFVVVRNPYDRLRSAYVDKILSGEIIPRDDHVEYHIGNRTFPDDVMSFSKFVSFVEKNPLKDGHWVPMSHTCRPESFQYDHILRLEDDDLPQSLANIFGGAGIDLPKGIEQKPFNLHHDDSIGLEKFYRKQAEKDGVPMSELVASVGRMYEKDLEQFGYSFPLLRSNINKTTEGLTHSNSAKGHYWTLKYELEILVPITMMLIKNSLLWCPIEKSGSTTVYNILYQNGLISQELFENRCGDDCPLQARKALRNWSAPKPLSFVVVRNPYDRLRSAYVDKILSGEIIPRDDHVEYHFGNRTFPDDVMSFSKFVSFVEKNPLKDGHWVPMSHTCRPESFQYDHILRLEDDDLPQSLANIFGEAGIDLPKGIEKKVMNQQSDHSSKLQERLEKFYRKQAEKDGVPMSELVASVGRMYKKDIEIFGYDSFSSYTKSKMDVQRVEDSTIMPNSTIMPINLPIMNKIGEFGPCSALRDPDQSALEQYNKLWRSFNDDNFYLVDRCWASRSVCNLHIVSGNGRQDPPILLSYADAIENGTPIYAGKYVSVFGPATSFGIAARQSFGDLLRHRAHVPVLHLGHGAAGPRLHQDTSNKSRKMRALFAQSAVVIIVVMAGRSSPNSNFPGLTSKLAMERDRGMNELYSRDRFRFWRLANESLDSADEDYRSFTQKIRLEAARLGQESPQFVLLWLSECNLKKGCDYHWQFPQYYTNKTGRNRLDNLARKIDAKLVDASYLNRPMGQPIPMDQCSNCELNASGTICTFDETRRIVEATKNACVSSCLSVLNTYYPTDEMHENAANLLEPIVLEVLSRRGEGAKNTSHSEIDSIAASKGVIIQKEKKIATPNNSVGPSLSLIVIASSPRSSSTFVSVDVLGAMPCHLSLGEILLPLRYNNTDDRSLLIEWEKSAGKKLKDSMQQGTLDINSLANFVLDMAERRCNEKLQGQNERQCKKHCWVNYKHFANHLGFRQSSKLWDALLESQKHTGGRFAMVVLERPLQDRWKSYWFARETGDWRWKGESGHKQALADASVPDVDPAFRAEQEDWFAFVRRYVESHQQQFPSLELKFDDTTGRSVNVTQALVREQIMNWRPPTTN